MNKDKIIKNSETYTEIISNKQSVKNKYFSIFYKKVINHYMVLASLKD